MQRIFTASVLVIFLLSGLQASEQQVGERVRERQRRTLDAHHQLKQEIQRAMESGIDTLTSFLNPDDNDARVHIDARLKLDINSYPEEDNALVKIASVANSDEARQLLENKLKELKE